MLPDGTHMVSDLIDIASKCIPASIGVTQYRTVCVLCIHAAICKVIANAVFRQISLSVDNAQQLDASSTCTNLLLDIWYMYSACAQVVCGRVRQISSAYNADGLSEALSHMEL